MSAKDLKKLPLEGFSLSRKIRNSIGLKGSFSKTQEKRLLSLILIFLCSLGVNTASACFSNHFRLKLPLLSPVPVHVSIDTYSINIGNCFANLSYLDQQSSQLSKEASLINVEKIEKELNLKFRILKTDSLGSTLMHKFCWISLAERVSREKVEQLANCIIKEIIAKQPRTFHSITIHFFWDSDLKERIELSPSFARAAFLPFGDWQKVGRVPLEDYKDYKLVLTFIEK